MPATCAYTFSHLDVLLISKRILITAQHWQVHIQAVKYRGPNGFVVGAPWFTPPNRAADRPCPRDKDHDLWIDHWVPKYMYLQSCSGIWPVMSPNLDMVRCQCACSRKQQITSTLVWSCKTYTLMRDNKPTSLGRKALDGWQPEEANHGMRGDVEEHTNRLCIVHDTWAVHPSIRAGVCAQGCH